MSRSTRPDAYATVGTAYLLHFDRPIGNPRNPLGAAMHYTGWAEDPDARIERHAAGHSDAKIMAYVVGVAGIGFRVAKVWTCVDRYFERRLKNRGGAARYCPICRREISPAQAPHRGPLPPAVAALAA